MYIKGSGQIAHNIVCGRGSGEGVTDQIPPIPVTIRSIDKAKLLFTFNVNFAYNSLLTISFIP